MALRETFLSVDLEPSVATSQTVATPYLREVKTIEMVSRRVLTRSERDGAYLRDCRTS